MGALNKPGKGRLDEILVRRGYFDSREKAKAAIMAGWVEVAGLARAKAGALIFEDAPISLRSICPYVSRGGLKLEAAIKALGVRVAGRVCLDLGASTGGFSDCLLQAGAAKVYAVDVGRAQLHAKLKLDPRVKSLEGTHARDLRPDLFDPLPDMAVIDVSFISLTLVLPHALRCLKRPCEVLALVKPQFELGAKLAPKGVVRDPKARLAAADKARAILPELGLVEAGFFESPVHGPKGNIESFLYLKSV